MRILFPNVAEPVGGKSYFLHLLYKELEELGATIVFNGPHDILFGSIRFHAKSEAKKVLRLDGVIHNIKKPWAEKNRQMFLQTDIADVIVCQSEFGKKMVEVFVQPDMRKTIIIGNGTILDPTCTPPILKYKHNFLAVSKWRPHKRLKDAIESFILADIPNSGMWVIGEIKDMDKYTRYFETYPNIQYLGHISDRRVLSGYMRVATASIHLCWFDCYPNSVVEAVAVNCPVICNNTGGTHEIVRPSGGVVLDLDMPYDYRPIDLYDPPEIDRSKVADAMRCLAKERGIIKNDHVDIKKIAFQYYEVFKGLM